MQRSSITTAITLAAVGLTSVFAFGVPAGATDSSSFLPISRSCGFGATLHHAGVSERRLTEVCNEIAFAHSEFTQLFGSAAAADDRTERVDVHVAQTRREYAQVNTMLDADLSDRSAYYEHEASEPGNVGDIHLNLEKSRPVADASMAHEFVHYLDGHINLAGNGDADVPLTWWIEGIAQALTNPEPIDAAAEVVDYEFTLSEIMNNDASDNSEAGEALTYSGGEMAVRYFMSEQPDLLREMLDATKRGAYRQYAKWHRRIGTSLDQDFEDFVSEQADGVTDLPTLDLALATPATPGARSPR